MYHTLSNYIAIPSNCGLATPLGPNFDGPGGVLRRSITFKAPAELLLRLWLGLPIGRGPLSGP